MQKSIFQLTILLLAIMSIGCNGDEDIDMVDPEEVTYPKLFTCTDLELNPSTFYQVETEGYTILPKEGILVDYDTLLHGILNEEYDFFPINEFEFLSDSTVHIRGIGDDFYVPIDTVTTYTTNNDTFNVAVGENNLQLQRNESFTQLKFCLLSEWFNYYSTTLERRRSSGISTGQCDIQDPIVIANRIQAENSNLIAVGDTLSVNFSYLLFDN